MQTLTTFINTGLAIAAAVYAHNRYNSVLLMVLVLIASYAFLRAFQQVFLLYYYRIKAKAHPMPVVHTVKEENWEDREEWDDSYRCHGMRTMIVTERLDGDKYPDEILAMEKETLEQLSKPGTLFELRYNRVLERNYPYQLVWSNCDDGGKAINDCVKTWYKSWALEKMPARQRDKDFFVYDGEMDIQGVGPTQFTGFVLFDGGLPVTLNNPYLKKKAELEGTVETETQTPEDNTIEAEATVTDAE